MAQISGQARLNAFLPSAGVAEEGPGEASSRPAGGVQSQVATGNQDVDGQNQGTAVVSLCFHLESSENFCFVSFQSLWGSELAALVPHTICSLQLPWRVNGPGGHSDLCLLC